MRVVEGVVPVKMSVGLFRRVAQSVNVLTYHHGHWPATLFVLTCAVILAAGLVGLA